jgi:hypothetical protein
MNTLGKIVEPLMNKRVRKIGGSYQHTGTIVSEFTTTADEARIVVEFDEQVKGLLHIFRPEQVEKIKVPIEEVIKSIKNIYNIYDWYRYTFASDQDKNIIILKTKNITQAMKDINEADYDFVKEYGYILQVKE